jgi:hypothetical protein
LLGAIVTTTEKRPDAPAGIGGWLILVAMVTCGSAFSYIGSFAISLFPDPQDPVLNSSPFLRDSGPYVCAVLALSWIFTAICLFRKSAIFPKLFAGLLAMNLLLMTILMLALGSPPFWPGILFASVFYGIWIWYVLASKRVANTFTASRSARSPDPGR